MLCKQLHQALADFGRWEGMMPVQRPDGSVSEVEWRIVGENGHGARIAMVTNVTEREKLLASERAARTEAERSNRLKDEFLATLSHELRNPLNAMLGWGRLLKAGTLDSARRERALASIERNALAQAQLIEELLDVSRIVSGKLSLEVASFDVAATVEAAVDTVRPALEGKGMTLQLQLPVEARPALGDAHRLQQVVWNLLSNAVKFTPNGGHIAVTLEQDSTETVLRVSDDGRGISPASLPFVFESFRQADSSTTRAFGGLGLGLSISRHLVELHGGSITAFSPGDGQGATFVVRLPLRDPRAGGATETTRRARVTLAAPQRTPLAGLRVLVVDDEQDARELTATILVQAGAQVVTAGTARDALALLVKAAFDILVSDIGMPEQDGYVLIRNVREHAEARVRAIPAAALTAYARTDDRERAIAAGFQLHVTKPVDPANLLQVVTSLAELAEQLRE
jgi:signal transduction histidine kinase/ActR/RegA family two-component response regulator